jgi:peroxidase
MSALRAATRNRAHRPSDFLSRRPKINRRSFQLESLEPRTMLAADLRAIDGSNNNLLHPDWGSTFEQLLRTAPAEYSDGVKSPAGADRLSGRAISELVVAQPEDQGLNERGMSAFIYVWGQFLDHDLSLTTTASPAEAMPVLVPSGDASFDPLGTGTKTIPLNR